MNGTLASGRAHPVATILVALPIVAIIGWLDYQSGPIAMSLLYFIPIVFVAWKAGLTASAIVAVGAGGAWYISEFALSLHTSSVILWNGFTRTVTFIVIAYMVALVRRDRDELDILNGKLQESLEIEARVARTDPLTGLPNSRSFREALERELARCQREGQPIGISYVDLDNFKKINDTLGHDAGDDALRRVGDALKRSIRAEDLVARLGGDEFAILSARPTRDGLAAIGERVVAEVSTIARDFPGTGFGCTLGMILFPVAPADTVAAVREADELMYEVKARSKGTFEVREHVGE